MRSLAILLFTTTCSCTAEAPLEQPVSACSTRAFEGATFTVCDPRAGTVEIRSGVRSFPALQSQLGERATRVAFAMNGGMFDDSGMPIGLLVQHGAEVKSINRNEGSGNFHLMPNGVFLLRSNGVADVVTSKEYVAADDVRFATQSGPMLVIDGKLHPEFDHDGQSRHVRNGVGIGPAGTPLFVISDEPVSFGKFARFFRDALRAEDALYFDGSVSSLWDPVNGRMDNFVELGPMVVAFKDGESAPDREDRATP